MFSKGALMFFIGCVGKKELKHKTGASEGELKTIKLVTKNKPSALLSHASTI